MFETTKLPTEQRTVTGNPVSFNTHYALPLDVCKITFEATQSGSGTPSPSNPRNITGISSLNVVVNSSTISEALGDTYYGGVLDMISGLLTINRGYISGTQNWEYVGDLFYAPQTYDVKLPVDNITPVNAICNLCDVVSMVNVRTKDSNIVMNSTTSRFRVYDSSITTIEAFNTKYSDIFIVYELKTPIELTLTPEQLSTIIGNNTFSTDTGSLEISFQDLQEKSASGSVATFNTALAMPLASCNIAVNAWQEGSGDPSPDNVRPIHGFSEVNLVRTSGNLWDEVWENGQFNWNTGIPSPRTDAIRSVNFILIKPNTNYYIYNNLTSNDLRFVFYGRNKEFISASGWFPVRGNNVITTPANAFYMKLCRVAVTSYDNTISVNYPSTDTDYHAYTGNIYPIQLGQEVYGAEVDVVNGVATITHRIVTLDGSEDWQPYQIQGRYYANDVIERRSNLVSLSGYLCDSYIFRGNGDTASSGVSVDKSVYMQATYGRVWIYDTDFETDEDLISYLSTHNVAVVYPLAEPFDIQLTPTQIETLIGNNTIFADTGDIDLTYKDLDIVKRGDFRQVFKIPD